MRNQVKVLNKFILATCLTVYVVFSQAGVADLSVAVEFDEIEPGVSFQQTGTFRITVTNNGPDAAGTLSTSSRPIDIFSGFVELNDQGLDVEYVLDTSVTQDCGFGAIAIDPRPGNPPGFVFFFSTGVIQATTSITCHGRYFINFQSGTRSYEWFVAGDIEDTDPVFINNFGPVMFRIAPQAVPYLSPIGLLLIFSTCLTLGLLQIKRTKQFDTYS